MEQNLVDQKHEDQNLVEQTPPVDDTQPPQAQVAVKNQKLTLKIFFQLAGRLAGHPFVKIVLDREKGDIYYMNHAVFPFHADFVGQHLMGMSPAQVDGKLDQINREMYNDENRRFLVGILSLQRTEERGLETQFMTLETVEVDTMDDAMVQEFFRSVREWLETSIPLLFKPANLLQEEIIKKIDAHEIPRIFSHELFHQAQFIPLNPGTSVGRLRAFKSEEEYRKALPSIEWHDIIVMHRVPDDIPRVSGIINAHHTTPLSHTNVLASGWKIPNSIQFGIFDRIEKESLLEAWVEYTVESQASGIELKKVDKPENLSKAPSWTVHRVKLEEPMVEDTPILALDRLRASDRYKYGTKAANLGEVFHVLAEPSERSLGFYRVNRPPRENLVPYLVNYLGLKNENNLAVEVHRFLKRVFHAPRGIAVPFSIQRNFLESSPRIQQAIGKLKMALELNAGETDALCVEIQGLIRKTRMPDSIVNQIDLEIAKHLSGVSSFVIRSSSNAEDLQGFSAAGIYESINKVTTLEGILNALKEVWASLISPRSVRLRHDVGISLDDCYMGAIIQEEAHNDIGGVLVTTNPTQKSDFRNVYMNVSPNSVETVVDGSVLPIQMLFNTVEGGARTLSLGDFKSEPDSALVDRMQDLAFAGRLLQSHFSPDYTFQQPVDIEWLAGPAGVTILQIRPYAE